MRCLRALSLLLILSFSLPSAAASNTVWFKRAFNDILLRQPTSDELSSFQLFLNSNPNDSQQTWRFMVAMVLLDRLSNTVPEWPDGLIGADPFKPGFYQRLLGSNPGPGVSAYYRCRFEQSGWTDERIIADMIGATSPDTCGGHQRDPNLAAYEARATAINPGYANCLQTCGASVIVGAAVDQIYQDLLGRHATLIELSVPGEDAQRVGAALAAILGTPNVSWPSIEYLQRVVRSGFLRFLRRLPSEQPGSGPDGTQSELDYVVAALHGDSAFGNLVTDDESFYAWLVSSPEYDSLIQQTLPAFESVSLPGPANILVAGQSFEEIGPPPPIPSLVTSPLFFDGAVSANAGAAVTLAVQVAAQDQTITQQAVSLSAAQATIAAQQQTIAALAVDVFGGTVSQAAAQALIDQAEAEIQIAWPMFCGGLVTCNDPRIGHALGVLALARKSFAAGDYDSAARLAKEAWREVFQLIKNH